MPKSQANGGSATATETVTGKVTKKGNKRHEKKGKKAEAEAETKSKVYFRIYTGKPAKALMHRNGITRANRDARQFLDSALTVFIKRVAVAALVARSATPNRKTVSDEDVVNALRIHANIDLLKDKKKRGSGAKKQKKQEA